MKLIVAHQILIGAAIALAVLFGIRAVALYARGEGNGQLAIAAASAVIAAALGIYLKGVRAKVASERKE